MVDVYLCKVGRNLNRAYRTCEAFGVQKLYLISCDAKLSGNLFRATDRVEIIETDIFPDSKDLLALETWYNEPLSEIAGIHRYEIKKLMIGGETSGLPKSINAEYKATIPMLGLVSGLTVEAALAIALYEFSKSF